MNTTAPFISICIPAYKNANFLKRLLESISRQSFRDFEVIITDDSPDDELSGLIRNFRDSFKIVYKKNEQALGTPENWNESIRQASGEWIKLMHDDDWFIDDTSLAVFASTAKKSKGKQFIFSAYNNIHLDKNSIISIRPKLSRLRQLQKMPMILVAKNIIGPPSTTLVRKEIGLVYDRAMKWFVDIDFYMQVLSQTDFTYIGQPLVNVGIHGEQVTTYTFRKPEVEIPEGMLLLSKQNDQWRKNIIAYDGWWRYLRNLSIRNEAGILSIAPDTSIPKTIQKMISFQSQIPAEILRIGPISKLLMSVSYLINNK